MADPLVVRLLGQPQLSVAASAVTCPSKKSWRSSAFLLLTGKRHSRQELAALFGVIATTNRRGRVCARIASATGGDGRVPARRSRIDRTCGVGRDAHRRGALRTLARGQDLDSLESAATLYQDELLKDFEASATPQFDDWLHAERVRLAQLAQIVFDGVIVRRIDRARHDSARATSERESALAIGLRWTSLMPGSEAAHRWLMRLYIDMGRRDAALAQYELCQRFLAVTHGRAPSPETRALQETALAGVRPPGSRVPADSSRDSDFAAPLDAAAVAGTRSSAGSTSSRSSNGCSPIRGAG